MGVSAHAALFSGNQIEIAWTGSTPFGSVVNNGSGLAEHTYTAPMGGTSFSTSPYASSTAMNTSVQDTTISITNNSFGFVPPQWFEYLDVSDTLPDFTKMTFAIDAANTTDNGFSLASDLQLEQHGVALEFAEVPTGQTVTIDVSVPEPATLGLTAMSLLWLGLRRK
jgi:hypothetical protein